MNIKNFIFNKNFFIVFIIILIVQVILNNSYSVEPEEFLEDPKQELRARDISKNIRCLVCQNQSIDESSAPLAQDLRIIIRYKITEGLSNKEIYKFLTERYGDFILLKPPFNASTFVLWFLPFILFIIGIFVLYFHNRKSKEIK